MNKVEELKKCSKSQLIDALLSIKNEEAEKVIEELIVKEDSKYTFYKSRIENIELDLIDESFGDPLPSSFCEEVVIDLAKQITSKITSSKAGCRLLLQLYKKESILLAYAPKLEIYFNTTFATDFSSYAKKFHNRDRLLAYLYNFIVDNQSLSGLAILRNMFEYLSNTEIEIILENLKQIPEKKDWINKEIEILGNIKTK